VRRGLGVAVVPSLLLDGPDETIDRLPVHHFIPDRRIVLTTRSNGARTPAVEFAAAIIRAHADE
jgi:DNA-binding transcriptional LysR family regulator